MQNETARQPLSIKSQSHHYSSKHLHREDSSNNEFQKTVVKMINDLKEKKQKLVLELKENMNKQLSELKENTNK
jgi:hypothetical protein